MALPPLEAGAPKETVAEALPAMALMAVEAPGELPTPLTPVGASGVVTGVAAGDAVDEALDPTALIAWTVKV
jgi:hypothetical protein